MSKIIHTLRLVVLAAPSSIMSGGTTLGNMTANGVLSGGEAGSVTLTPAWRTAMAQFQWTEFPGTATLSGEKPAHWSSLVASGGLSGRLNAWSGFSAVGTQVFLPGGGGHVDWAGNEVYGIQLSANAPVWTMRKTSSLAADIIYDSAYYLDGKPTSLHIYYSSHGVGQQVVRVNTPVAYGSGNFGTTDASVYDLATNDWLAQGSYPNAPAAAYACAICKDPRDDSVYFTGNSRLFRRSAAGVWTQLAALSSNAQQFYYTASAVDTLRNRVVYFHDAYRTPSGGQVYDIATDTFSIIDFTGTGVSSVIVPYGLSAWYVAALDKFVICTGATGGPIYLVDPVTWAVTQQTTTGGSSIAVAVNGIFNKFIYIPEYQGVFYMPQHASNAWFLALG